MKTFYYVEADGGVFTVKNGRNYSLPQSVAQIPFQFEIKQTIALNDNQVHYCTPLDFTYDPDWPCKDDLLVQNNVSNVLRRMIAKTRPHNFTGAIVPQKNNPEKVLLLLQERGYSKGLWTTPGGFLLYAQDPRDDVARETKEECGLIVVVKNVLDTYSMHCKKSGCFFVGTAYECVEIGGKLKFKEGEIKDGKYFGLEQVINDADFKTNHFTRFAVQKYAEKHR